MKKYSILASMLAFTSIVILSSCGSQSNSDDTWNDRKVINTGSTVETEDKSTKVAPPDEEVATNTSQADTDTGSMSSSSNKPSDEISITPTEKTTSSDSTATGDVLPSDDSTQILAKFQEIYPNKDPLVQSGMTLQTVEFTDSTYFQGSVIMPDRKVNDILAIKKNGGWKIVSYGNASDSCKWIVSYKFPSEMAPDCYTDTGSIMSSSGAAANPSTNTTETVTGKTESTSSGTNSTTAEGGDSTNNPSGAGLSDN